MKIRVGYELVYECPQPTFMILMLNVHYSRASDLDEPDHIITSPRLPLTGYRDSFGNWCTRIVAPAGQITIRSDAVVRDSGAPDPVMPHARQTPVEQLPDDALLFLLASRYCETDRLMDTAWSVFGKTPAGWPRVQAILDYVHQRLTFGYQYASSTKTAFDAHEERRGVCRDFAHLALTLCRCMNIPARYCTGYLGDIGVPLSDAPMDFSGWFEVFLDGQWQYALMPADRARQRIRFFDQYRSYVINYNLGQDMVRAYIESRGGTPDRPEVRWREFTRLLASPRLPGGLKSP